MTRDVQICERKRRPDALREMSSLQEQRDLVAAVTELKETPWLSPTPPSQSTLRAHHADQMGAIVEEPDA